jgi:stearoyl-CoA desaturase (delta-9 desaturase)
MREDSAKLRPRGLVLPPTYGYGEVPPRKPTLHEVFREWIDAVAFWREPARLLPAAYAIYHLLTFIVFVVFFVRYFSIVNVLVVIAIASGIATIYNTIWYHRYCSHRAFKFRNLWLARVFLWTNPVCFREESYVIPHRIHHSKSDEAGDPYGPHLGWLGSYLATESQQKVNLEISRREFDRLSRSLEHVGFLHNSYEQYQRIGSVEKIWHYAARVLVAHLFWCSLAYVVAGGPGVLGWISGVFLYTFIVRDFNYRGHAGPFFTAIKGTPINQLFYGYIAGEWHENHHAHPRLARSGLRWWQLDIPYILIWVMKGCGLIIECNTPEESTARKPISSVASA